MKKQLILLAELLVSLAIIAAVLYLVDVGKVAGVIANANLWLLLAALITYSTINAAMSLRIKIILDQMGHKISLASAIMSNFAGMLVSDFTPARGGYFATAFALTANHKIPLEKSIVSILGPQLFDFMLKAGAGTIAIMFILLQLNLGVASIIGVAAGVLLLCAMIAFGLLLLFSKRFLRLLKILDRIPFGGQAHRILTRMQENADAIRRVIPHIIALLAFTWAFKGLEWWLLAMSIGLQPSLPIHPYLFYLFLQPLITILQFIPTPTLAGIGVSEAGVAAVLALFGVPVYEGVAYGLLTRGIMVLIDLVGVNEARVVVRKNLDRLFEGKMAGWEE